MAVNGDNTPPLPTINMVWQGLQPTQVAHYRPSCPLGQFTPLEYLKNNDIVNKVFALKVLQCYPLQGIAMTNIASGYGRGWQWHKYR